MPKIGISSEAYERIRAFGERTGVALEHAATAAILLWVQTDGEEIVSASRSRWHETPEQKPKADSGLAAA